MRLPGPVGFQPAQKMDVRLRWPKKKDFGRAGNGIRNGVEIQPVPFSMKIQGVAVTIMAPLRTANGLAVRFVRRQRQDDRGLIIHPEDCVPEGHGNISAVAAAGMTETTLNGRKRPSASLMET